MNPAINLTTAIHFGVVEDRDTDPRKLGRCRVRVVGIHTEDKTVLPTKDLPWAYPMQTPNSAAMNGIGYSPTGPVEGTWCLVVFRDEYKQHPIIIGTVGGIPEEFEDVTVEKVITTQKGSGGGASSGLVSSDGTPVTDSQGEPVKTDAQAAAEADIKSPSAMTLSAATKAKLSGYTASQIEAAEKEARSSIKVPITQGMYDATVSMMLDAGTAPISKSKYMSSLNAGKYEEAAAMIPSTNIAQLPGSSPVNTQQSLKDALGAKESSNNYGAVNRLGYMGKYQMGAEMLTDLGYVKPGTTNSMLDNPSVYTGKDGITSKKAFLDNNKVQESAMDAELKMNEKRLRNMGVIDANTTEEEKSGYLATSHLLGTGGARDLKKGVTKSDANGVTGQTYFALGKKSAGSPSSDPKSKERRNGEKDLFLSNGIPKKDSSAVAEVPTKTQESGAENRDTKNPAVLPKDKTVAGGDIHGKEGKVTHTFITADGFRDPKGKYPKKDWLGEPDTHRLARHEKIKETIVQVKDSARMTGVDAAFGVTWDQPPVPYNAKYPFNHTKVTESGHVDEWDDTPGNERIHRYHIAGTYEEVDKNGSRITRIVGDDYEILERHGNVLIKGNCNVTIKGDSRVRIENNAYLQILGSAATEITGDWEVGVGGQVKVHSGGDIAFDAPHIWLNSSKASDVRIPGETGAMPNFGTLENSTRNAELNANYETPEEGDPAAFNAAQVAAGNFTPADLTPVSPTAKKDEAPAEEKPKDTTPPKGCDGLTEDDMTSSLKMGSFTLGSLSAAGSSGMPKKGESYYGVPALQVVCNMKKLAENVLDPIKAKYPNMVLTSVWRSEAVNTKAGGSKTSDHLTGCAADIQLSGFSRKQMYEAAIEIQKTIPASKQIILEYKGGSTWIHVSYKEGANSNQVLTMDASSNTVIKRGGFMLI